MNQDHNCNDHGCVDFNESASVEICPNTAVVPVTTPPGVGRIIRVPVTLAERSVTTNLSANINFPYPVLEIKDIKKRVKIIQCSLMLEPVASPDLAFTPADGRLFLKGFIRKNIQYASPTGPRTGDCVSSEMKSLTVDMPFQCMTIIPAAAFITPPERPVTNARAEFDFFRAQDLGTGYPEKDQLLSSDLSQFHQDSTQFYNQFPFCQIVSSSMTEWDEAVDRQSFTGTAPFEEGYFTRIVEKVFLEFTIKVLQNQQVRITAI